MNGVTTKKNNVLGFIKSVLEIQLKLSNRLILGIAYVYMLLPIVIFIVGWIKPIVAFGLIACIGIGFFYIMKFEYKDKDYIAINLIALLLILVVTGIWVYTSGVGAFWPQKQDWHWRNALLRDLIDYSWPVEYPRTNNTLVYYYNFFLPSALIGKLFGWGAANASLCVFTWIGVVIVALLLYKVLNLKKTAQVFGLVIVFVIWGGLENLRRPLFELLQLNGVTGYQFSANDTLLQWVTNQTIVPWIAVMVFLQKRNIRTYIFLGMCVLASAPLPFVGMFIFLACDGILQLINKYNMSFIRWFKDIICIPNICGIIGILIPYSLFFLCNTATNGSQGVGGVGLYVPLKSFNIHNLVSITTFLIFNFIIFSALLFKRFKADCIYWIMNISLILIPFFKVGEGNDFGMRACIPAQFVLMVYVLLFLLNNKEIKKITSFVCMIVLLSLAGLTYYNNFVSRATVMAKDDASNYIWQDGIYTFSNKSNKGYYCGLSTVNFLCNNPEETIFFKYLSKNKSIHSVEQDVLVTNNHLTECGFSLISGIYYISPLSEGNSYLAVDGDTFKLSQSSEEVLVSNSTVNGKYEIYFNEGKNKLTNTAFVYGPKSQKWGTSDVNPEQLFDIVPADDYYYITWNGECALTYDNGRVYWDSIQFSDSQKWSITP